MPVQSNLQEKRSLSLVPESAEWLVPAVGLEVEQVPAWEASAQWLVDPHIHPLRQAKRSRSECTAFLYN